MALHLLEAWQIEKAKAGWAVREAAANMWKPLQDNLSPYAKFFDGSDTQRQSGSDGRSEPTPEEMGHG